MLNFDARGNLKPYELIPCRVQDLKKHFVRMLESETRKDHFGKYIHYSNDLKKLLGGAELKQWVNGSFVTRKKNPKDIDLVTFIDHAIITKMSNKLDDFTAGGS